MLKKSPFYLGLAFSATISGPSAAATISPLNPICNSQGDIIGTWMDVTSMYSMKDVFSCPKNGDKKEETLSFDKPAAEICKDDKESVIFIRREDSGDARVLDCKQTKIRLIEKESACPAFNTLTERRPLKPAPLRRFEREHAKKGVVEYCSIG